jgi:hypothetical protein
VSALRAFLDEIRAFPKMREATAAGTILQARFAGVLLEAKPAAEHLADMERFVERVENSDDPEICDRLSEIVRRDAPIKERLDAWLACLKPYDRKFRGQ